MKDNEKLGRVDIDKAKLVKKKQFFKVFVEKSSLIYFRVF